MGFGNDRTWTELAIPNGSAFRDSQICVQPERNSAGAYCRVPDFGNTIMLAATTCLKAHTFSYADAATGLCASAGGLLRKLQQREAANGHRAELYRDHAVAPFVTALWIAIEGCAKLPVNATPNSWADYQGLWLVELEGNRVFVYGCRQQFFQKSIGGRVIHNLEMLNVNADWVSSLAQHNAAAIALEMGSARDQSCVRVLCAIEQELITRSIEAFTRELDPDRLAILRAEGGGWLSTYNHYASFNMYHVRNRLQAAQSFPWFSHSLRENPRLRRAVDRAEPLAREIAECYRLQPRTLKHFQTNPRYAVPTASRVSFAQCVDRYSADYLPRTQEDQETFAALVAELNDLADLLQIEPVQLAAPFKKGWKNGLAHLEGELGESVELAAVFEMMQASFHYGVRPLLKTRSSLGEPVTPPACWYVRWFSSCSLKTLLAMASEWHTAKKQISLELYKHFKQIKDLSWPSLLPQTFYCDGLAILELHTEGGLEYESKKMENCVHTYCMPCLVDGSYIFAVRNEFGSPLTTFEVTWDGETFELVQHKAKNNSDPVAGIESVVQRFISKVLNTLEKALVNDAHERRRQLGKQILATFPGPQADRAIVELGLESALQTAVEFTHPSDMNSSDILAFFAENCLPED